jgi:hypothetical protein
MLLTEGGYLGGFPTDTFTLNLTGLNPAATYSLLLYVMPTGNYNQQATATVGSTTFYWGLPTTTGATELTSWAPATSTTQLTGTNVANPVNLADYVEFDGLTGSTTQSAVVGNIVSGQDFDVTGFQLTTVVPEPASVWTVALGLLGIVGMQRKRFFKV